MDNKTPKEELGNIHALVISVMLTNKAELVEVNGYSIICSNNEAVNNCHNVFFTSVPCKLQEDMESYCNELAFGDLFDMIYIHLLGGQNYGFVLSHGKETNL